MDWIQHGLWPWMQSNGWLWVERLSWLVAIVGIPSLLIGLLAMGRRPKLAVGLMPFQRKRRLLHRAIDLPASEVTQPAAAMHRLEFVITNVGRATARELLLNYTFHGLAAQQLTVA